MAVIAASLIYLSIMNVAEPVEGGVEKVKVEVIESVGMVRVAGEPRISYSWRGENVVVVFLEDAPNPCYKHELNEVKRNGMNLEVNLKLKPIPKRCVQVLGTVKTKLLIGPAQPQMKITINGLDIVLEK